MQLLERIRERAKSNPQRIVLCEAEDPRILKAASMAADEGLARVLLVGDEDAIVGVARQHGCSLNAIELVDPAQASYSEAFAHALLSSRQKRGMTSEAAQAAVLDPLVFATLMVREDFADGSVAGAVRTTAEVVRNAIQLIGTRAGSSLVSSFFLMLREVPFHGDTTAMIFSDCGLVVDPNEEELAQIALAAVRSAEELLDEEPKLAMLSFSTSGSASHAHVEKVRRATESVRAQRPTLIMDGEVQLDAAIVPDIAQRKIAQSQVRGRANVLVFPTLDAANIGYKLTERLAGATAIGPLLQGLARPANDLSRGCSADDVYNAIAVTSVQAQAPR